ncbi:MAG: hypothetical protein NT108_02355 [Candidatus Kaiserbacteria bacterium]|nr:hypothetical protein [Candidatus Kaiserbacteria bacterium]
MITDADITKLKKTFATKEDLESFATKEDLKGFATKEDLKGFATKQELKEEIAGVRLEIGELHDKIDTVASAVGRIENALDGIAGAIQDLRTENSAGAVHLARHDRQIKTIALATSVTLPD